MLSEKNKKRMLIWETEISPGVLSMNVDLFHVVKELIVELERIEKKLDDHINVV